MNKNLFYKGLLSELRKQADELPEDRKKRNWIWPALGIGAAGLGAGLLYNKFKGGVPGAKPSAAAPDPTAPSFDQPDQVMSTLDKASLGGYGAAGLGSLGYSFGKALRSNKNVTLSPEATAAEAAKATRYNRLTGYGDMFNGGVNMWDSYKNPDNNSGLVRGAEGLGGAAQTGFGALGAMNKNVALPTLTRTAGKWGLGTVARGAGSVAATPMLADMAAQLAISHASNAAQAHSDRFTKSFYSPDGQYNPSPVDALVWAARGLKSPDPKLHDTAVQYLLSMKNSPKVMDGITNPGGVARSGYNPVPWPFNSSKLDPEFGSYTHNADSLIREAVRQQ